MSDSSSASFRERRLTVFTAKIIAIVLAILAVAFGTTYFFDEPMHSLAWWQLFAVSLAVFGALAVTDGWVQHTLVRERLGGAITWIVFGAILAAVSSVVSAYGWNQYSETIHELEKVAEIAAKRQNLAKAVAAEQMTNLAIVDDILQNKQNEEEWEKVRYYPRFLTGSLQNAISSGLFVDDAKLLEPMTHVVEILSRMNARFAIIEQALMTSSAKDRATMRKALESPEHFTEKVRTPMFDLAHILIAKFDIYDYAPYGQKKSESP